MVEASIRNLTRHYADGFSLTDSLTIDEKATDGQQETIKLSA
jgi:hypothetical protein